jgi:class 3 adenylate cyclase/tetratricopeptide (TPR) repeat protein
MTSVRPICATCGSEAEPAARFCPSCGAALTPEPAGEGEIRKVVTALFSDLAGSTLLGEGLDPESLRRLMSRYYEEMRLVLERHGGTVEKFIGDAVVAVFGIPQLHEDDALRAVRAAVEMREALGKLSEEFERSWGVSLAARTGVNTGEVVAGDPGLGESFAVGDAVNVAARLEQAAQPGEILIGASTYRLVREAVHAEELEPLAVTGKTEPVAAWRLLDVVPGAPGWTRRLDSPLVDRAPELGLIREIFERTTTAGSCAFVTLTGSAGVGKSRLTGEFLSGLGSRATVLTGRCLPYGEGITFWPIVAVLRDAAGIGERDSLAETRRKLAALLPAGDASLVGDRLEALLGLGPAAPGIQETFWAVRKLLEHLGAQRPLVVVFDDIQWGEPTFLDLVEYLADWIRAAPVLLLCLARPDILEVRPTWTAGKPNATMITLQPLSESETQGLIENLVGGAQLEQQARARIAEVAEGNPLFVEEMLRMLVDDGLIRPLDGRWSVVGDLSGISIPPTIQALLTARLDRLEAEERAVVERASVVGRVFWWGAVAELSPPETRPRLASHLQSLMRKELIRPDYSEIGEEDAFRFTHILIPDAAYQGMPKAVRAELHERLADWLAAKTRDLAGGYEEILGYHLEQAYESLVELGARTARVEALGRRAAAFLSSAGRRAFARGDMPGAVNLLSRAVAPLSANDPERLELLPQLAFALLETGDFARLQDAAGETSRAAEASGDPGLRGHALVLGLWIRLFTDPEGWAGEAEREATRAIAAFEEIGDERGLAKGWSLVGLVHLTRAHFGPAEEAWRKAAHHARLAGDRRDELECLSWVPLTVWAGPAAAEAGLPRCREAFQEARGDKKAMSSALIAQAAFEAGLGRFDEARALLGRSRALLQEVALTVWLAGPQAQFAGWVELLAGEPAAAERELRAGYDTLNEIGEQAWLSTVVAVLAEAVYGQGRYEEAEELAGVSEGSAGTEDTYSQVLWRSVLAKVSARRGEGVEAEALARESVRLAKTTDFLHLRWHALMSLAETLQLAGRPADARSAALEAAAVAERKGNRVGADRARALLDEVAGEPTG